MARSIEDVLKDLDAAEGVQPGEAADTRAPAGPRFDAQRRALDAADAPTPEQMGTVQTIQQSMNERIAKIIGLPLDAVAQVTEMLGNDEIERGKNTRGLLYLFKQAGFLKEGTYDEKSLAAALGRAVPDSMIALFGIRAGSPTAPGMTVKETGVSLIPAEAGFTTRAGMTIPGRPGSTPIPTTVASPTLYGTGKNMSMMPGAVPGAAQSVAKFTAERPMTSLIGSVGAVPGAEYGAEIIKQQGGRAGRQADRALGTEFMGPVGEATGEVIGSTAGGLVSGVPVTRAAQMRIPFTGRLTRSGENMSLIPKSERAEETFVRERGEAIVNPDARPGYPRAYAEEQIARYKNAIDDAIKREVELVEPNQLSNAVTSDRFRSALATVEKKADAMVSKFWDRVDKTKRVPTDKLEELAELSLANSDAAPSLFPRDVYVRIQKLAEQYAGAIPLSKLVGADSLRSEVLQAAREAGGSSGGNAPNTAKQRKLYEIAETILKSIEEAFPNDIALKQANEISKAYHDRFTRGPLQPLIAHDYNLNPRVLNEEALDRVMQHLKGTESVLTAASPLPNTEPRGRFPMVSQGGKTAADIDSAIMVNEYEQGVRARYANAARDAITQAGLTDAEKGPRAAAPAMHKWMRDNKAKIEKMANTTAKLQSTTDEIVSLVNERHNVTTGALRQYTHRNPTNSANAVLDSENPQKEVATLINNAAVGFRNDREAMEGWQRALVEAFLENNKSYVQMQNQLRNPKLKEAFEISFSDDPAKFTRFQKMINTWADLETGAPGAIEKAGRWAGTLFAKIGGLHIGRLLAHTFSTGSAGSLALPQKMARETQAIVGEMMDKAVTTKLIAEAVQNPHMEQRLLRRSPSNITELEREYYYGRRYLLQLQSLNQRLNKHILQGGRQDRPLVQGQQFQADLEDSIPLGVP
jgi:hypothetical protein